MDKLIYLDGMIADQIGRKNIEALADLIEAVSGQRVSLLTHSPSYNHENVRVRSGQLSSAEAKRLAKVLEGAWR